MSGRRRVTTAGLLRLLSIVVVAAACSGPDEAPPARLSLTEVLGGTDTVGFERALEPRTFRFPADHGPHPRFRTEWWYLTGNLEADGGRRFGFQFTIFRVALAPRAPESPSAWATNQAYMGHLALTDVEGRRFHAFERFARGALGLAGASGFPFRVWLEDWVLEGGSAPDGFPMTLRATEEGVTLSLALTPLKRAVPQGDRGLSRKGLEPGNASYYYSFTRLVAEGSVVTDADTMLVGGSAWLDREWSTSVLDPGTVGWDWFALQLDDGWDLMLYRLRGADGSTGALSEGVLVDPEGVPRRLRWGADLSVEVTHRWTSPVTGTRYPAGWHVSVPARGYELELEPVLADQELDLSFRYWEGAVRARSTTPGSDVGGWGYAELTGYDGVSRVR